MKKNMGHSRAGLFLMEMILSLLFLALACSVCVRLFAASRAARETAAACYQIQTLITAAGEILEGSDGSTDAFLSLLPGGTDTGGSLEYYFDKDWSPCGKADFSYKMEVALSADDEVRQAGLSFLDSTGESLYALNIRYPQELSGEEDSP